MITQTEGIILHTTKYSESSIIAHIFTKEFGAGSYIMNNVRHKRSKMAYFQIFSHVDISVYRKKNSSIHRISNIEFAELHLPIYANIIKASICQFLGEILHKLLHSEEENKVLFSFITDTLHLLAHEEKTVGNFHLVFLINLTHFFGITPQHTWTEEKCFFDLHNGEFICSETPLCIDKECSFILHSLLSGNTEIVIPKNIKIQLLESLIQYYKIHTHNFGSIQSLATLQTIFE
ncbi:MAG: DNA repair protein RecO [Bacteroidales bacterium]